MSSGLRRRNSSEERGNRSNFFMPTTSRLVRRSQTHRTPNADCSTQATNRTVLFSATIGWLGFCPAAWVGAASDILYSRAAERLELFAGWKWARSDQSRLNGSDS